MYDPGYEQTAEIRLRQIIHTVKRPRDTVPTNFVSVIGHTIVSDGLFLDFFLRSKDCSGTSDAVHAKAVQSGSVRADTESQRD